MAPNNNRGFASMEREEQRRISSMGGKASHQNDDNFNDPNDENRGLGGKHISGQERDNDRGTQQRSSNRGFAAMDEEEVRRIASKGGRAAHERGTAHEWNSEEAREAGRRGGRNSHGGGRKSEGGGEKDSNEFTRISVLEVEASGGKSNQ